MGISVHEALQLPTMLQTKLVAGKRGLNNTIKWVTIVEVIEDITRLQEGEFLITSGFGLKENKEPFEKLLAMGKLSGVAIYTGFYLDDVPEAFIRIADSHNLPLIEIPQNINFSTISKEILEQILNKQMELTSFSLNTHKELTGLVLKNKGELMISETLASLTKASIFIVNDVNDSTRHVIRHDPILFEDEEVYVDGHPIGFQEQAEKCRQMKKPVIETLKDFKVIYYPIIASGTCYGMILSLKEQNKWTEIDFAALEHAATVYAIEYLKQSAVKQTQLQLKGQFLEEVLTQNYQNSDIVLERGKTLGYDLSLQQAVLYLKLEHYEETAAYKELLHSLNKRVRTTLEGQNRQFIIRNRLDGLTILYEVKAATEKDAKADSFALAERIMEKWLRLAASIPLRIGIGKAYDDINKLSQSSIEAKYACDFADLLMEKKSIIHYEEVDLFHLLYQMKEVGIDLKTVYEDHLIDLISYSKKGIDLIHTLEIYFKNNSNIQMTSSELFVHRHTLKYRLNLITKRSGYDLNSPDVRLKLMVAIAAYKLDHYLHHSEN